MDSDLEKAQTSEPCSSRSCGGTERSLTMAPTDPADLAAIRLCERLDCKFVVNNAVQDILQAMSNHILSMHPVSGSSEEGGGQGEQKVTLQSLRSRRNIFKSNGLLGVPASNVGNWRVKYQTSKLKTEFCKQSQIRLLIR